MIESLKVELVPLLPLKIQHAAFTDPTLTLAGETWAFSSPSAWRVIKDDVLEFGWSDVEASDMVWDLCGLSIVAVEPQSLRMTGDPAFRLSDGRWLEIFSDHAVDPWSLQLPSMTFVGSPSDPSQTT
ncbi:hypothetical protein [Arthrobacter sp. M4]|uniref:hypothetical protein n=1 Tax=Arthrobacter sp. M4 TaxID=218160 RepID=UPI001CDC02D0|nr:hypothetical protein [Arthrobacter sp. M4]MCA4133324.1 hypothetical protein [Arthrobacter sp. M4]